MMDIEHSPWSIELNYIVPFGDTNSNGVVSNYRYLYYFDMVRAALLSKIGLTYSDMHKEGYIYPVYENHFTCLKSIELNQSITLKAAIVETEVFLQIAFQIKDTLSCEILCTGYAKHLAFDINKNESYLDCPKRVRQRLHDFIQNKSI